MSRRQECKDCGCSKSEHNSKLCKGCLLIYWDNKSEYLKSGMNVWHKFKLDNLKYLEEIYERRFS